MANNRREQKAKGIVRSRSRETMIMQQQARGGRHRVRQDFDQPKHRVGPRGMGWQNA